MTDYANIELRELPLSLKSVRRDVEAFLVANGLLLDQGLDYYAGIFDADSDQLIGGAGLQGNVIKCIAVRPEARDLNLSNSLVSHLRSVCFQRGYDDIFVFTKPENDVVFESLSFHVIGRAPRAIFCESKHDGIASYCRHLAEHRGEGSNGVIVMNCNPITLGHYYLIETAARQVDRLHVILVKEDKSVFPFDVRYQLVRKATEGLGNVVVHPGSSYVISSATFPNYFIKEPSAVALTQCQLDVDIFARYIAPALGATVRFVGEEPMDHLTALYNRVMQEQLPQHGIQVVEIARKEFDGVPISASMVRDLLNEQKRELAYNMLPPATQEFLSSPDGQAIIERLKQLRLERATVLPASLQRAMVYWVASAMKLELMTQGKPGLVCPETCGSHHDLDYETMYHCIDIFTEHIREIIQVLKDAHSPREVVALAQPIAQHTLSLMETAARGANTYRGAVFSLGLCILAYAYIKYNKQPLTVELWQETIREMALHFESTDQTKGGQAVRKYGIRGALDSAWDGYDIVFHDYLPYFESLPEPATRESSSERRMRTLLHIMSTLDDSNIYSRAGAEVAQRLKQLAHTAELEYNERNLQALRSYCQEQWISPGGSADMLILTLFIHQALLNERHNQKHPELR